jgi:hypothetical protein
VHSLQLHSRRSRTPFFLHECVFGGRGFAWDLSASSQIARRDHAHFLYVQSASVTPMALLLVRRFDNEMLLHGQHVLKFRTITPIEAADLLYVHDYQLVNALEPAVLSNLVEAILRKELNSLLLPEPNPKPVDPELSRIWFTENDSLVIAEYNGPPLEGDVEDLLPKANIRFWFVDFAREFRYWIWHELTMAYSDAVYSFRQKLGPYVKFPFQPMSEKDKEEVMFWHWTGLVALMRKAIDVGAYPIETLEALDHIHRTLW